MRDFVEPEVKRLQLSRGRYVDVKKRLNAGETRHLFGGMVKRCIAGEPIEIDPEKIGLSKLVTYLVGWSLVDAAGQPVPVSEAAIGNLDPDLDREIQRAIDAHEAEIEAQIEEEKKDPATVNGS